MIQLFFQVTRAIKDKAHATAAPVKGGPRSCVDNIVCQARREITATGRRRCSYRIYSPSGR